MPASVSFPLGSPPILKRAPTGELVQDHVFSHGLKQPAPTGRSAKRSLVQATRSLPAGEPGATRER